MKLNLKSEILEKDIKVKGYKETEDYWAFQLKDHHESSFDKLSKLCKALGDLELSQEEGQDKLRSNRRFVIVL